jgi:hypothetical protein
MPHAPRLILGLAVSSLLWGAPASAQSITVGGQIIFENWRGGTFSLLGENFHFHGDLPTFEGPFDLALCHLFPCLPGTVMRVGSEWGGSDFSATITYNGQTFSASGALRPRDGLGVIDILGFITVPELVGTIAAVTVPFSLQGWFRTPESMQTGSPRPIALVGRGTVTVTFLRTEEPGAVPGWSFGGAIYTLQDPGPPPFSFTGFFSPVDNDPVVNTVKAGAGVPLKFSLDGDQGLDVFQAGFPASQLIACDSFAVLGGFEKTVSAGESGLTYDSSVDQYTYVWKTEKSWADTCRQLKFGLTDGSFHVANFRF